jgi:hypothetical protein
LSADEFRDALERPGISYCQAAYGPGRQVRQRGRLGVIVDMSSQTIITVVFRRDDDWQRYLGLRAGSGAATPSVPRDGPPVVTCGGKRWATSTRATYGCGSGSPR